MRFRKESFTVDLRIPGVGGVSGKWVPDLAERQAAWELYVELATRVTTVSLGSNNGLLRESLTSFHAMFEITREVLKRGGPNLARQKNGSDVSLGGLAFTVLNRVLRPLLGRWHPELQAYEASRPLKTSPFEHEQAWPKETELRDAIEATRNVMIAYANELAKAAQVSPIVERTIPIN
jgi:hypothetical protein